MSPSSQYPEDKFVYEDLDTVRNYINLVFGEASSNEGSANNTSEKDGSPREDSAGGVSATCTTPWLLLQ